MPVCTVCGEQKPKRKFRTDNRLATGHRGKCLECESKRLSVLSSLDVTRTPRKFCKKCWGLAHRVEGECCSMCGLQYQEEPCLFSARGSRM